MIDDISPCVGICKLDKKGELCTGCSRTIDDIRNWNKCELCGNTVRAIRIRIVWT